MNNAKSDLRHPRSLLRPVGEGGVVSSSHARVPKFPLPSRKLQRPTTGEINLVKKKNSFRNHPLQKKDNNERKKTFQNSFQFPTIKTTSNSSVN